MHQLPIFRYKFLFYVKFTIPSFLRQPFIAYFYKYGFVGIMLDWIEKGMDENYNEIVDDLEKTVHGTIDLSIKNFTNNKK